ncbi:unnamed protein product [Heligmosomoides polygyrus]|uniref:Transposase_23 domain-containing protein n=1 Tax=Heligmosomoides polygyrus TaxID=6339 RepID=A0A183FU17_HELPZ|nr:unnamed protein product [Heligmosomoides polygyrus]
MSTFAAVIRANGVVKQFCPDIWPLQAPRTVSIADALREINDFIAVSLCVNTAFNSMMQELKIVREERDTLCEKNLSLRQKLGLPLGLADHDAVDGFPPRSTPSTVPRQSVAKNEMERRRSIIISEVPELGDVSIERRFRKPKLKGNENYTIYVGTKCPYDSESSRKYHIAEVWVPSSWERCGVKHDDIAIIELEDNVSTKEAQPICVPAGMIELERKLKVSGWGRDSESSMAN